MRRPTSPVPRRSHDTRPDSPPGVQLRRVSSDSHRSNRSGLLSKFKNAGATPVTSSNNASTSNISSGQIPSSKLPPRSHSRGGSNPALSPPPSSSSQFNATATTSKVNTSPKSARDMHRLGNGMAAQVALAPALTAAASASSLSLASTTTLTSLNNVANAGSSTTDPWHMLHVHVLPLFNGEPLRIPIEDLNQLVKKRISSVVSRSPSRAISSLEQDVTALLAAGMITLNVKLSELGDEKLLLRVGEVWEFFWHQVLPYVEGVFHPLQTDKLILSLSRTPKTHRTSSPTLPEEAPLAASTQSIDVRVLALRSFRDSIILPISGRLHALISSPPKDKNSMADDKPFHHPRLQQMLLVLVSTARHSHSLTAPSPSPSQGENAVTHLLRAIRSPQSAAAARPFSVTRLPSFFAGSAPRDRRGRIARKSARYTTLNFNSAKALREDSREWLDDETPRNAGFGDERDREKAFLESLRSPELEVEEHVEEGAGGWGLGRGQEHQGEDEEDDEDEPMDWDQAQDVVQRMVGLRA